MTYFTSLKHGAYPSTAASEAPTCLAELLVYNHKLPQGGVLSQMTPLHELLSANLESIYSEIGHFHLLSAMSQYHQAVPQLSVTRPLKHMLPYLTGLANQYPQIPLESLAHMVENTVFLTVIPFDKLIEITANLPADSAFTVMSRTTACQLNGTILRAEISYSINSKLIGDNVSFDIEDYTVSCHGFELVGAAQRCLSLTEIIKKSVDLVKLTSRPHFR